MSTTPLLPHALRRTAAIAFLVAGGLSVAGCGGGGWFGGPSGTLEVQNSYGSFYGVDAVEISTLFGPVDHFDVFLAPGEAWNDDFVPDSYDVDLWWSDGSFDTFGGVDVFDGGWTTVTGAN